MTRRLSVKQSISRILNEPDGVRVYFFALIYYTIDQWSSGGQNTDRLRFLQVSRFSIQMSKINSWTFEFFTYTKLATMALMPTLYSQIFAVFFIICGLRCY